MASPTPTTPTTSTTNTTTTTTTTTSTSTSTSTTHPSQNHSSPNTPPSTLLTLPTELRLKIYTHILTTGPTPIPSIRPQRKIGWNRPHADLTNPALLFESDAHVNLKRLFHSKLTKGDHALILETVLRRVRVLVVDHADLLALLKVAEGKGGVGLGLGLGGSASGNGKGLRGHGNGIGNGSRSLSASAGATRGEGRSAKGPATISQSRSLADVVRRNLRVIDFSDRMDEIVCQPNDIVKLVKGLPGLRSVVLTSRHVQRYSGTIEDHVEFAREREERERGRADGAAVGSDFPVESSTLALAAPSLSGLQSNQLNNDTSHTTTNSNNSDRNVPPSAATLAELRRLTLRSPMTDGTRLMISPLPTSKPSSRTNSPTWVVVDLSMLIWQHFLYVGPPYRDYWRPHKVRKLLDVAEGRGVDVVLALRGIEFDPGLSGGGNGGGGGGGVGISGIGNVSGSGDGNGIGTGVRGRRRQGGGAVFRGEMSSRDWMLRIRQVRGGGGAGGGVEYVVKQRREIFEEAVYI